MSNLKINIFLKLKKILIFLICFSLLIPLYSLKAFSQYYEGETLNQDINILSDDNELSIIIPAKTFQENLNVYLFENNNLILPEYLKPLSRIYNLNLIGESKTIPTINIKLNYKNEDDEYTAKSIYLWQNNSNWLKIDSLNNWEEKYLEADLTGNNLTFAVGESLEKTIDHSADTFISADGLFEVEPPTSWSSNDYSIIFKSFDHLTYPENLKRISDIYEFDIKSLNQLDFTKPIKLIINYNSNSSNTKNLYYWDNYQQNWLKLPTTNDPRDQYLTTKVFFKYLRLAIFEETASDDGEASWYKYKNCLCAASRDYPKNTRLKITNITEDSKNFDKSIIVKINDYGPEEWTGRIIDLDKKAYQQLGNLKGGIMYVRIEKIND